MLMCAIACSSTVSVRCGGQHKARTKRPCHHAWRDVSVPARALWRHAMTHRAVAQLDVQIADDGRQRELHEQRVARQEVRLQPAFSLRARTGAWRAAYDERPAHGPAAGHMLPVKRERQQKLPAAPAAGSAAPDSSGDAPVATHADVFQEDGKVCPPFKPCMSAAAFANARQYARAQNSWTAGSCHDGMGDGFDAGPVRGVLAFIYQ